MAPYSMYLLIMQVGCGGDRCDVGDSRRGLADRRAKRSRTLSFPFLLGFVAFLFPTPTESDPRSAEVNTVRI